MILLGSKLCRAEQVILREPAFNLHTSTDLFLVVFCVVPQRKALLRKEPLDTYDFISKVIQLETYERIIAYLHIADFWRKGVKRGAVLTKVVKMKPNPH